MSLKDALNSLKKTLVGEKGRDGFVIEASSPDYRWQKLFSEFLGALPRLTFHQRIKFAEEPAVQTVLDASPAEHIAAIEALIRRRIANEHAFHKAGSRSAEASDCADVLHKLTVFLLRRNLPFASAHAVSLLTAYSLPPDRRFLMGDAPALLRVCERFGNENSMSPQLCDAVAKFSAMLNPANDDTDSWEGVPERRIREGFERLLSNNAVQAAYPTGPVRLRQKIQNLDERDPWAETISKYLAGLDDAKGSAWDNLIVHARNSAQTKASSKWLREADRLLGVLGRGEFRSRVTEWFPLVRPSVQANKMEGFTREPMIEANSAMLKGLVWICSCFNDDSVTRAVSDLGQTVYKKLPGWGPLSAKVGNACLFTLSQLPGLDPVAQLSRLRLKVKYATALRLIDRALEEAATKLGMTAEELEEIAVPTYGLDQHGHLREEFGDFTAEVSIVGTNETELSWLKSGGKPQKSTPAWVKEHHAEDFKELKRTIQDIGKMLPAQRDRLERLFLSERELEFEKWVERYLHHPLVGQLARRLIWHFRGDGQTTTGIWHDGKLVDAEDRPLHAVTSGTFVRLWHPLGVEVANVSAWRRWLETHEVAQPFKQAHREIYILTEAEQRTGTYSNRFAAHIIKQHQFAALARQRSWAYTLQGQFDSHNTPTLRLPRWNLSVEYWVDAAGGNAAVSDMGIFLYLATDQVRFIDQARTPVALIEVPALVFSEAMRDIDLFVGICSVGNDPAWQDTGERGHDTYWRHYSFGELSASAHTRRAVLEGLLPRLKVAGQCSLIDKFLVVKGSLRTYKIHLGSGNILMEPNDQYLCIVPDRGSASAKAGEKVFLPFEGDSTLSIILSKAFLLAEDQKIKDPTILRQVKPE